jgi:2-keto-3-deoxy-L-rhamnonate aldolase RhmA
VRLASDDEVGIKKALDVGAAGIIVPQVNTAEQAERVVRMSRYPPLGTRGVGLGRANLYGMRLREYLSVANDVLAVVVQAEHVDAVRNIEAIARVPGLDAVFVGPYDLSASMGLTGQVDHPDVVAAIERVASVCQAAGMRLGIFGASPAAVRPYIERGFTLVVGAVDTLLFSQSAVAALGKLRPAGSGDV